ncbi:hypothetical protein ABQE44_25555 [Mycolicibacterium sp. XJ2546]
MIGDDGLVMNAWKVSDTWNWQTLPTNMTFGGGTPQVAAVSKTEGNPNRDTLDVFAIGDDGQVWRSVFDGREWDKWSALPAKVKFDHATQRVAAVSRGEGKLDLFAIGDDGQVWSTYWEDGMNNDSWGEWFALPGGQGFFPRSQQVAAVARSGDNLDLFVIRDDGEVWTTHWYLGTNEWADWSPITGGPIFRNGQRVSAVSRSGTEYDGVAAETNTRDNIDLFAIDDGGRAWSTYWEEGPANNWGEWFRLGEHTFDTMQQVAAVARSPENLDLFVLGNDERLYTTYWSVGADWPEWEVPRNLGGARFWPQYQNVAAVSRSQSDLDLFVLGNNGELWTASWLAPRR